MGIPVLLELTLFIQTNTDTQLTNKQTDQQLTDKQTDKLAEKQTDKQLVDKQTNPVTGLNWQIEEWIRRP